MMRDSDPVLDLAGLAGILPAWVDLAGTVHTTTRETALALLRAMDLIRAAGDAAEVAAALRARDAERVLPDAHLAEAWRPSMLPRPMGGRDWRLVFETGGLAEGRTDGYLELPALPPGLHRLESGDERCLVVAAPPLAPSIPDLTGRERIWGFSGAVHALHSARNPSGRGDFEELAATAEALAPLGAAFLGVNPVHALGVAYGGLSPYSPGHRGFLDTRAVAPDQIAEFAACAEARRLWAPDGKPAALIDYVGDATRRGPALRALYHTFRNEAAQEQWNAFARFRESKGVALEHFGLFEALSARFGANWREWPAGHETPDAPAARAFAAANADAIAFHAWLQWQADVQLGAAHERARKAGMTLGIYADIAVGVRPDGAEVWAEPAVFARGVSLGAPPDQFAPSGQSWGLAPFSPLGLAQTGYAPFVATIRAAMRHAGLIRIDHILGFDRAFWVPEDGTTGGYVRMPCDSLMAIVRAEAARSDTAVIGEDLGVVPEGLREKLARSGFHGSAVMQFERDRRGSFRPPRQYRREAAASIGTHDTPTLAGWWESRDIDWAERLGRTDAAGAARWRAERRRDRVRLLRLVATAGLLPVDVDPNNPPTSLTVSINGAIHALLGRTPSAVAIVQLDDALGAVEQPNIPGTTDEHPNWQRALAARTEELASHPMLAFVAAQMRRIRG